MPRQVSCQQVSGAGHGHHADQQARWQHQQVARLPPHPALAVLHVPVLGMLGQVELPTKKRMKLQVGVLVLHRMVVEHQRLCEAAV